MEKSGPHPISPPRRRRISTDSNSPEFEFWMLRNPTFPQPNLLTADELFSDGVLLPLHLLNQDSHGPDGPQPPLPSTSEPPVSDPEPGPEVTHSSSGSKRWKDLFRKSEKKTPAAAEEGKDRKREKKSQLGASSAAELNIHLWPFSRSRSAGARPRNLAGAGGRKVSSAPCSRSNSAGESKSRSSPGRAGVHLGRSSPVWQVRRTGSGRKSPIPEPAVRNAGKKEAPEPRRGKASAGGNDSGGAKVRGLNMNVPMCIGYRNHFSCRSNENRPTNVAGGSSNVGNGGGTLFNIRNLFTKKVY